ncbi:MAG TPA: ankyrin repeat domain-containing protein [Terriglobales bacterium]|nr:ankyrin repeat domain-containing protein [Terriglobales bacterium]
MFPNPQDALPLPQRPKLEQYRKLAKELVRAARVSEDAIRDWASHWIDALVRHSGIVITPGMPVRIERWSKQVARHAIEELINKEMRTLTKAQFVIARAQGFESWPKFSRHLHQRAQSQSETSQFEAAADAIVSGDAPKLKRLLRGNPELVRARSTREHGAALLHYVSANGVEGFRQRTPKNILEIAKILLDAGAEVDAICHVYRGDCTTLSLAATSVHPANAGVMDELLQLLLDHGARIDRKGSAGNAHWLVFACLANGQPGAARFLAGKGAYVDFVSAAALGLLEEVQKHLYPDRNEKPAVSQQLMQQAFRYACGYGAIGVVEFLLHRGADVAEHCGDGFTGTHYAAMYGHAETVKLLLRHHPPLEIKTNRGGTVLWHALESAERHRQSEGFLRIIDALIFAGAVVPEKHPPVNPHIDALLARQGGRVDPQMRWFEE